MREHPDKAALAAVTSWLPQSVAHWLNSLENGPRSWDGSLLVPVTKPILTPELSASLKQSLWTLRQTTAPCRDSMPQLIDLIQTLLTGFKWRTFGGEENVTMNLKVWCEAVSDFPMYAVEKAVRWNLMGSKKEPSIAELVADVRLAAGHRVLERRKALEDLVKC